MTQEEFDKAPLLDQILYDTTGMLVENHPNIAEAMDKYHQAKLKLLGISDVSVSNLMQEVTSKLISDIQDKRNKVITERLKEIVGIDLNIEEEVKRRFKRLAIEYNGNEETIYFNDGSIEGKRIVTFVRKENPLKFETDRCEMSVGYSYY